MVFTLQPVTADDLVGRKVLLDEIIQTLTDKKAFMGFAFYGRRRIGKTSLLLEIERRLKKEKYVVPVYFSLWDLTENSIVEFAKKLSYKIIDAYKTRLTLNYQTQELVHTPLKMLKKIIRELKIGVAVKDDIEFFLTFEKESIETDKLIEDLLNLPEKLSKETNTRCVLLLDEFPSVIELKNGAKIGEGIIKKIRTINERYENTVLCISGSIKKTMEIIVLLPTAAFYRQFIVKEIKSLDKKATTLLIKNNLTKKITDDAVNEIFSFTHGIPFYIQFVGRRLETISTAYIDINEVHDIVDSLLSEEGNILFKEEFNTFSPKERKILEVMAVQKLNKSSAISKAIKSTPSTVRKFLMYLEEKGIVIKNENGIFELQDPIFQKWLERRQ